VAVRTVRARPARCALRVALLCATVAAPAAAADVVARVNGTPITAAMVNQVVKSLIVESGGAPSSEEIARLSDAALDSLIDLELLYEAAQKEQIHVSDQEVQAEIARSKARVGGDQAFAAALQRSGLSEAQLAAETRKTLMVDRFLEQRVLGDLAITPQAEQRFYDQHREAFQHGDQVHLRELVVRVRAAAPAAERGKARQLADELHGQLHGGAAFAQFAKTYATDPDAAAHGGDRGFVDRDALPAALAAAAFALPVGQLSEVIEAPDGYHLIIVVERRPAGVIPFEEARPAVEQALRESDRRRRQQDYVAELRKHATIARPTPGPEGRVTGDQ
jgi:peptidyl-prolyl cis-trans isomerase C